MTFKVGLPTMDKRFHDEFGDSINAISRSAQSSTFTQVIHQTSSDKQRWRDIKKVTKKKKITEQNTDGCIYATNLVLTVSTTFTQYQHIQVLQGTEEEERGGMSRADN